MKREVVWRVFEEKYLQVAGIDQLDSMLGQFVAQRLGKVGAYQRQL